MPAIALSEAQDQLTTWLAASKAVASGQSYSIAGRSLSRVNATEIRQQIDYWESKVNQILRASSGRSRTRYGVNF